MDTRQMEEDLRAAHAVLNDIRACADSDDGLIGVALDANGAILELTLSPRIYSEPDSEALASLIVATIERAQRDALEQSFAAVTKFLPPGAELDSTDLALDPILHQMRSARE